MTFDPAHPQDGFVDLAHRASDRIPVASARHHG